MGIGGEFTCAATGNSAVESDSSTTAVRLQKLLAMAGAGSRRQCEELILAGRVTVDRQTVRELGAKVVPERQEIRLDGERLRFARRSYYLLNKPPGYLCTNRDPQGRPRVLDLFRGVDQRLFTVGRLDEESQGLLIVTNDGELAQRLTHPRFRVEKVYRVEVVGVPAEAVIDQLKRGFYFAEGRFKAADARLVRVKRGRGLLEIVLLEGQNREIRRLLARIGHKVKRLERVRMGPIKLGALPLGAYRQLTRPEVAMLQALARSPVARPSKGIKR
jgi:23S rRNA pseudouridine2605 synthase